MRADPRATLAEGLTLRKTKTARDCRPIVRPRPAPEEPSRCYRRASTGTRFEVIGCVSLDAVVCDRAVRWSSAQVGRGRRRHCPADILRVAYDLSNATDGVSLSVTVVLRSTGSSTRAFHRHFESRDAVLVQLMRRDSERVLAELRERTQAAPTARAVLETWILEVLAPTHGPRRRAGTFSSPLPWSPEPGTSARASGTSRSARALPLLPRGLRGPSRRRVLTCSCAVDRRR
jgi:AcrR family transcriptional regulator